MSASLNAVSDKDQEILSTLATRVYTCIYLSSEHIFIPSALENVFFAKQQIGMLATGVLPMKNESDQ